MMNVSSFYFRLQYKYKNWEFVFLLYVLLLSKGENFHLTVVLPIYSSHIFLGGDKNLVKMAMCDKIFMGIHYVIGKRMN